MTATTNRTNRLRRAVGALLATALGGTWALVGAPSAYAVGTLTSLSWAVSNNQASATGVTYTYNFKTATTGIVTAVTFTVPSGTAGTPTVVQNVGIGAGTVALSGTTITYTLTSGLSISGGIPVLLSFGGLTNTATTGSYTSTITSTVLSLIGLDSGTTPAVSIGGTNTATTVYVAKSTAFSTDTSTYTLAMDPGLPALADDSKVVTLTILSNAGSGYSLNVKNTGMISGSYSIPAATSGMASAAAWPTGSHYGYNAVLTGSTGSPALGGTLATAGNYAGYTTGAGQNILTATGATGNTPHSLVLTNRVAIDYTTPAATYTDTVTYTLTPSY